MMSADVARQALEYYKQRDAEGKPRQEAMDKIATQLAQQQIESSAENTRQGKALYDRYTKVGIPAEDQMYKDAREYGSVEQQDAAAGRAATDVDIATGMAGDARRRQLARSGVNPADGRSLAMEQDASTQGALAKAGAMNTERNRIKDMGIMLRKDAASFAKGMPGTAGAAYGVAGQAGAGATGAIGSAIQTANQTTQTNGAGFGTAIQGAGTAGSILNTQYGNQVTAGSNSGIGAAIGGIAQGVGAAGGVASYFSDENMKEERQPVDEEAALKGIENTNVESWRYKQGTKGDDGGQEHVGAMAQDMQENLGDTVAPGGKKVDIISAIGVNMAATKALAQRVDKLQATIAKGVRA